MTLNTDTSILRSTFQETGYIYCIANKNYKGWVKVGMTKDPEGRLKSYNAYAPTDSFYYFKKQKVPHYRLSERHLIHTFSKNIPASFNELDPTKCSREEWFKVTQTEAEKYFLEVLNTLEEYVHSYCSKTKNKIQEKKKYHANKLEEYAFKREEAKRKRLKRKQEQEKKWAEKEKYIDPLREAAINRIEKNRRVQQNLIALQKSRKEIKPLMKLLYSLETLHRYGVNSANR